MSNILNTTTTTPAATLTAKEFNEALEGYAGPFATSLAAAQRLYVAAQDVLKLNAGMPASASFDVKKVLGSSGWDTWRAEGGTYASAARLIREKLEPVLNGEAA